VQEFMVFKNPVYVYMYTFSVEARTNGHGVENA